MRLEEEDISTSHPLPSKIVVKFTRRDVSDRFYSNRSKLAGNKIKDLPDIAVDSTSPVYLVVVDTLQKEVI